MAWRYETLSLFEIYERLSLDTRDVDILQDVALKAYNAAVLFKDSEINEEYIRKYLDGRFELGATGELFLATTSSNPHSFSRSHNDWLYGLSKTKLKWDWKSANPQTSLKDEQNEKVAKLVKQLEAIQQLALSYNEKCA